MRFGWIFGIGLAIAACGSGSSSNGGGGAGGTAGSAGNDAAASCNDLEAQYGAALQQAKVCTPSGSSAECTLQVADALRCPCGATYVNATKTEAIKTIGNLGLAWNAGKCSDNIGCPNIFCPPPSSGVCKPDPSGNTGTCSDVIGDAGP